MNGVFLDSASLDNDVNLDAFDNLPINWRINIGSGIIFNKYFLSFNRLK